MDVLQVSSALVNTFLLLGGILAILVTVTFFWDRRHYGSRIARSWMLTTAVMIITFFAMMAVLLVIPAEQSTTAFYIFFGGIALSGIVALVRLVVLQPKTDAILLDLDDADDSDLAVAAVVEGLYIIWVFFSFSNNPQLQPLTWAAALCFLPLMLLSLARKVRHTYVTEARHLHP